jgi:hypothetical protein
VQRSEVSQVLPSVQGPLYFANQLAVRNGLKLQELRALVRPAKCAAWRLAQGCQEAYRKAIWGFLLKNLSTLQKGMATR